MRIRSRPVQSVRARPAGLAAAAMIACLTAAPAAAQSAIEARLGAHAVGLVTRADPALGGAQRTETYITHPMLLARLSAWQRLALDVTINLEGWTLTDGEFALGNAGEGYVDKRHPHTFLHEAIVSAQGSWSGFDASLSAGRGFAPFGTDDPMVRPFVKYPANHHWSQILERLVVIGALRRGPVTLEAGLFNGDEPNGPEDLGRLSRLGDSWSARATLAPRHGLEAQASYASVTSPEHALGGGLDQRKWSASARATRTLASNLHLYALVEWAETHEYAGDVKAYIFTSVLAESELRTGDWRFAARFERTTRPEEERLFDPFRTARPHGDENIIGATRWNTVTAAAGRTFSGRQITVEPFVEVAYGRVREITGAIFDPDEFFGSERLWNLSIGARIRTGMQHERMGRYGVARPAHAGM